MFYPNSQARFYTSAGDDRGTSAYFVYGNGVLRAKTATRTLHVRPGKNLAFIAAADSDPVLQTGVRRVRLGVGNALFIDLRNDTTVNASRVAGGAFDTPVDFYLTDQGLYDRGQHVGHALTGAFDPGNSGVTLEQINAAKAGQVNADDTAITGAEGDVPI